MATAKKLPSGNWRTRVIDYIDRDGKKHTKSFTAPTKKESEFLAAQWSLERKEEEHNSMTIEKAIEEYIALKEPVLSPSTIRGYDSLRNNAYDMIKEYRIDEMNDNMAQKWLNSYCIGRSPKTVANASNLLKTVLKWQNASLKYNWTMPQNKRVDCRIPTDEDVKQIIDYYHTHCKNMYIASCLAAFGTMRRGEICGLDADHVKGNVVQVRNVMVKNKKNHFETKEVPKTESSARDIVLPQFVIDEFPKEGRIVPILPDAITKTHIKTIRRLGITPFRFHDFRHYSASILHALNIPDQYIMQRGGWSSDKVLKQIYRGTIDDYEKKFENIAISHFEGFK